MSDDADTLATQNLAYERENRRLRKTLLDEFAKAALTGLLAHHGAAGSIQGAADTAYEYATAMLEARKEPA